MVPTGLTIALPPGFEAQVRPRSGLAAKHGVTVLNSPGTVDADYRGEINVLLINHGDAPFPIRRGERIAQMVIAPVVQAQLVQVDLAVGHRPRHAAGSARPDAEALKPFNCNRIGAFRGSFALDIAHLLTLPTNR